MLRSCGSAAGRLAPSGSARSVRLELEGRRPVPSPPRRSRRRRRVRHRDGPRLADQDRRPAALREGGWLRGTPLRARRSRISGCATENRVSKNSAAPRGLCNLCPRRRAHDLRLTCSTTKYPRRGASAPRSLHRRRICRPFRGRRVLHHADRRDAHSQRDPGPARHRERSEATRRHAGSRRRRPRFQLCLLVVYFFRSPAATWQALGGVTTVHPFQCWWLQLIGSRSCSRARSASSPSTSTWVPIGRPRPTKRCTTS